MRTPLIALLAAMSIVACGKSSPDDGGGAGGSPSTASRGGDGQGAGGRGVGGNGNGGNVNGGSGAGGTSKPDGGGPSRRAGCGTTPPHTTDFDGTATDGDGTTRSYSVLFPTGYDPTNTVALTFGYHGAGGTSSQAEGFDLQGGAGARAASMFVFPQGIAFQQYGVGWDDNCGGRDMVLFDHILADLEAHYCIDPDRIFAAGFSWGCDQVTALHCCRGDAIRAIGAASCTDEFGNAKDATTYANLPCPSHARPAIRFTHDASGGDSGYAKPLFTTTSTLYTSLNACSGGDALPAGTCTTHAGCGSPFVECPYDGLGHATPANWGPDTWAFFAALPR